MAVRVEDLSGPRNINLLQALSRLDWKHSESIPQDPMSKLTQEEARILKDERGITYNGPYRLAEGDIHLGPPQSETPITPNNIVNFSKNHNLALDLGENSENVIFSSLDKEPLDTGEYYSNGDRF